MEIKTNPSETSTEILSFAGSGNICFCDDYKFDIRIYNIVYPSIRNAVLSWKTDDLEIKRLISKTILPFDLKDLENEITNVSSMWKPGIIKSFFESYTFKKFNSVTLFAQKLISTGNKKLSNNLMLKEANLMINELQNFENFEGITLMNVRDMLLRK